MGKYEGNRSHVR